MADPFETFVLYYTAWHEHEFSLPELKTLLLEELGTEGFESALHTFRTKRLERKSVGDKRTLYDALKEVKNDK